MTISYEIYKVWKDQPILHDEDMWGGKYKTYGEMWIGENYTIEAQLNVEWKGKSKMTNVFTNEHATINGRNVWLHVVSTDIGNIFIVQHENADMDIVADIFFNDLDGANKVFSTEVARLYEEYKDKFVV